MIAATTRDVLTVRGPDAADYLQGQVSNDAVGLGEGESCWTLLLQPQGKVVAWGRLTRTGAESFAFDTDPGAGAAARERLERFRLRVEVAIELEAGVPTLAVRDAPPPAVDARLVVPAGWPDHEGVDVIGPSGAVAPDATPEDLERLRIEAGVPSMGAELDESVIPAEAGPWLVERSVDFTKGCYVGQELVARVDSRGSNTPRRVRRLRLPAGIDPGPGAEVRLADAVVGQVTSSVPGVALARLARKVEVGAAVEVVGRGGPWAAEVEEVS